MTGRHGAWTLRRRDAGSAAIAFEVSISSEQGPFEGHFPGKPLLLGMAQLRTAGDLVQHLNPDEEGTAHIMCSLGLAPDASA